MLVWWNSLTVLEQVFAAVAFSSTAVLLMQTVMLMFSIGAGGHDFDHDHDIDHDAGHGFDHDHDIDHDVGHGFGHDHEPIGEHDHDAHMHEGHDPGLRIFTVRGFVSFFCIFGWAGLAFLRLGLSVPASLSIAVVLGFLSMLLVAVCLAFFLRLQSNGNIDPSSAVGLSGTVYIPIPPERSGAGKITANVAGRFSEYDAVTDETQRLPTGAAVTVVSVTGADTLVVIKK